MNLGAAAAREFGLDPRNVLLLRHFNGKVDAIREAGATVEEFTLVQPKGSRYDFLAEGREPIQLVVVIVDDKVHSVYRILDVATEGSNRSITSAAFRQVDSNKKYPERLVRRFRADRLESGLLGKSIRGWTNPRSALARAGGKLFEQVTTV